MIVPAYLATFGVPYCASLPKSLMVFGRSLPKFHTHAVVCAPSALDSGPSDQYG